MAIRRGIYLSRDRAERYLEAAGVSRRLVNAVDPITVNGVRGSQEFWSLELLNARLQMVGVHAFPDINLFLTHDQQWKHKTREFKKYKPRKVDT